MALYVLLVRLTYHCKLLKRAKTSDGIAQQNLRNYFQFCANLLVIDQSISIVENSYQLSLRGKYISEIRVEIFRIITATLLAIKFFCRETIMKIFILQCKRRNIYINI